MEGEANHGQDASREVADGVGATEFSDSADDSAVKFYFQKIHPDKTLVDLVSRHVVYANLAREKVRSPSSTTLGRMAKDFEKWTIGEKNDSPSVAECLNFYGPAREFFRWVHSHENAFKSTSSLHMFEGVSGLIDLSPETNIGHFGGIGGKWAGRYRAFREQFDEVAELGGRPLLADTLELSHLAGIPWFRHHSEQVFGNEVVDFDHEGPVFCFTDTLFLLGVGSGGVRQWTVKNVERPKSELSPGIAITKGFMTVPGSSYIPMATNTVLVREEHYDSQKDKEDLLKRITAMLQNHPEELRSRVYAWPRDHSSRKKKSTQSK